MEFQKGDKYKIKKVSIEFNGCQSPVSDFQVPLINQEDQSLKKIQELTDLRLSIND